MGESKKTQDMSHGNHAGGHRWMMIACCIPMIAVAITLAITGVAGIGFLLFAAACTVMMVVMMGAMSHGGK